MPVIVALVYLFPCGAVMSGVLDTDRHATHRNGPGSSASLLLLAAECSLRQGRSGADRQWLMRYYCKSERLQTDRRSKKRREDCRFPVNADAGCHKAADG